MLFLAQKRRIFAGLGLCVAAAAIGLFAFLKIDALREQSKVTQLSDIEQLKEAFNEDVGAIRLIVLLSPT